MTTTTVRYPAPIGLHVKCERPATHASAWVRFEGRTGTVTHNSRGEIAVELDGAAGYVYWFRANELVKTT